MLSGAGMGTNGGVHRSIAGYREPAFSTNDGKRALNVSEAVFRYGIGRTNLYRLMKAGTLRSVKIGRRRLIPVDALEALIAGE